MSGMFPSSRFDVSISFMLFFSNVVNDHPIIHLRPARRRESPENRQDRQLVAPVVVVELVAVAEPLAPSVGPREGARLRQPDVPGWKRTAAIEKFSEGAAFTFKGRQIVPLLPRRQSAALFGCPTGRVEMIHGFRRRQKPDGFIVAGQYAAVYLAFVISGKRDSADFKRGFCARVVRCRVHPH